MKLKEFLDRFGNLSDEAFLANFQHPFLLEEGRLALEEGGGDRQLFLLRGTRPFKIGRSPSADIRLRHEQISTRHAILFPPEVGASAWQLMDANSTNGTFLDGAKIPTGEKTPLREDMLLRFGLETRLTLLGPRGLLAGLRKRGPRSETAAAPTDDPLTNSTKHDMKAFSAAALAAADLDDEPPGISQELMLVCDPYDPVRLVEGNPLVIGRTPKAADIVLPHAHVSRRHALIERRPDGVYVKDLGSSNGCYICGVRVGTAPMLLLPGKPLELGPFTLRLEGHGLLEADPSKTQAVATGQTSTLMGQLELTPLVDLLQAIETEEKTGSLILQSQGGLAGKITFRRGEPYNASTEDGKQGAAAIRHLLELERGTFVIERDEAGVGERTITLSFGEILLDDFLRGG